MPTRDQRRSAIVTEKLVGSPDYVLSNRSLGQKQSISALNSAGMFVPGILRLNPVLIERWISVGLPASNFPSYLKYGTKNLKVEGDIAAWCGSSLETALPNYAAWDSTMASYSLAKAYGKLGDADFDVGMILVELHETINGLFHPFTALRKYIRDFNKMRRRKTPGGQLTDTLNMLSGSWLEWRYGVTPLIITIESAIKHFKEKSLVLEGKLLRKRGKVVRPVSVQPTQVGSSPGYCTFSGKVMYEVEKKTVSSIYFKLTDPISFEERYGIDLLNAPALIWERIPLSFVVDWFIGVGQWLQSIHLSDKRTVVGSSTSQKTTVVAKIPEILVSTITTPTQYSSGSTYVLTYERLERRVNLTPPPLPVVNPALLSLQRRLDALTLIWQRLPKLRR